MPLTSTEAPASASLARAASASSLETASLIVVGALSTASLASFRPRLVNSRTALITLILVGPAAVSTTLNSVGSASTSTTAAAPSPWGAAATATGAAAVTP